MANSQLTEQHKAEALSQAYVHAVAARAGANVSTRVYDYGIDGSFHEIININGRRMESGITIHCQLKASKNWTLDNTNIIYDLEAKTYNDLIIMKGKQHIPCVLILLCLPQNPDEWLEMCEEYLQLRKCCYWIHVKANTPTSNRRKVRISIPRNQRFTPDALITLFNQIKGGTLS